MHSRWIRFALVIVAISLGAYQLSGGRYGMGLAFVAAGLGLLWVHLRYGTVSLAFVRLQAGDVDGARRLIGETRHPNLLAPQDRAYYELIVGMLASLEADFASAEVHLRRALRFEMRRKGERAVVEAHLATALLENGKSAEARELIETARSRNPGAEVIALLDKLEETIPPDA